MAADLPIVHVKIRCATAISKLKIQNFWPTKLGRTRPWCTKSKLARVWSLTHPRGSSFKFSKNKRKEKKILKSFEMPIITV
jgi:hypothetical protein